MKNNFQNLNQIIYLKAEEGYCLLVGSNGKDTLISRPIKFHASKHGLKDWLRIHRSYLVNPLFVSKTTAVKDLLVLKNGKELPIARRRLKIIMEAYINK